MSARLSKKKFNLLCVAHPDDETIFFGGLLLRRGPEALPFSILCVTSDGQPERRTQFDRACEELGADESLWWAYPDRYEMRLEMSDLVPRLRSELSQMPESIYTHGIVGEYGHPHHQDVSFAVHEAFAGHPRLFSSSYNCFPELKIELTSDQFALKTRILTQIYGSETSRFLNVLPATAVEGFVRLEKTEVDAIYHFLARGQPLDSSRLSSYRWLESYLPYLRDLKRPF